MDSSERAGIGAGVIAIANEKKRRNHEPNVPYKLGTGHWALVKPVSIAIIQEAQASVEMPKVPLWYDKDKDREHENPNDPAYLVALQDVGMARGVAAMDAVILFGVELVNEDGTPYEIPGNDWVAKLKLMERLGTLSLSNYDFDDTTTVDFLYKRFVAVSGGDLKFITEVSGLEQDVEGETQRQAAMFPNNS
jgi:hypothetical protein